METIDSKDFQLTTVLSYAPEPIHKINHATQKTVVVIGKEHFLMCKQLMQDNAQDEEYAKLLNVPIQKIRYFKHKMQIFEDRIRARRRAARLNRRRGRRNRKKPEGSLLNGGYIKKKEMTAEERLKYARELILENYSTQEIAKVLRVSERSITRFRRKLNEQKRKLQEEGKITVDPEELAVDEEEYKFKFLSAEVKAEKINELYEKGLAATEIAKILKISDRSVRRWKIKLDEMKVNPEMKFETKREKRRRRGKKTGPKRKVFNIDQKVIERAQALVDSGESNKEISEELQLPMSIIRKMVKAILDGTSHKAIEESLQEFTAKGTTNNPGKKIKIEGQVKKEEIDEEIMDDDDDFWNQNLNEMKWGESSSQSSSESEENTPLAEIGERVKKSIKSKREKNAASMDPLSFVEVEDTSPAPTPSTSNVANKSQNEKRGKTYMGEREVIIAKLLKDKGVRAVDIALLMDVSERSVTRLLAKAKELKIKKFDDDIVEHVNDLIDNKEEILDKKIKSMPALKESKGYDDTKRKTGMRLLAMHVKPRDIAKMLSVSEKTIKRWQMRLEVEESERRKRGGGQGDDDGKHEIFNDLFAMKEEPPFDIEEDEYF
ncbi:hypothetical protein PVAND_014373 [Polypedilum vanderplanki]|uniref:Uncharacterized protein n=1 Tax=Polypedilum vanderplanki TaxID=319348 RepID=A0A9J6B9E8_POLVA|nr:hypothetical protein PVAND_014373 [Polypedilum vanderplanki]